MSDDIQIDASVEGEGALLAHRYRILKMIGSGGMACVYLARDCHRGREVAVKMLHSAYAADNMYVERFIREAQLMRKVDHPNVIRTFDINSERGKLFFTMEYCLGYSLEDLVEVGGVDVVLLRRVILQLCDALDAIHAHDIVHRDLKPSNVLVNSLGQVKLTDFGIAHPFGSKLTGINEKLGCLEYMAPEILTGGDTAISADFYALGILIYQLFSGEKPFEHPELMKLIGLHTSNSYTPLSKRAANCPDWLNALVRDLLLKDPQKRITSTNVIRERFKENAVLGDTYERLPRVSFPARDDHAEERISNDKIFRFSTGSLNNLLGSEQKQEDTGRSKKITIKLPADAAVVFELEPPSREVIYFGVFLASLQVLDGLLTSKGLARFGIEAEGNPILRSLMAHVTPDQALMIVKALAIAIVIALTVIAKRSKFVKDVIGMLSCIYLCTAILPWIYVLLFKS